MFKLEGKQRFDYAALGDSNTLRVGQPVAAMGNPFVLAEDNQPTITLGIISGLHRYQEGQGNLLEYADCIQVSTSINPGNSGGPLFDLEGCVIGINGRRYGGPVLSLFRRYYAGILSTIGPNTGTDLAFFFTGDGSLHEQSCYGSRCSESSSDFRGARACGARSTPDI